MLTLTDHAVAVIRNLHVFVQPDAAAALGDKALGAQVNEDGEVSFQLQSQG